METVVGGVICLQKPGVIVADESRLLTAPDERTELERWLAATEQHMSQLGLFEYQGVTDDAELTISKGHDGVWAGAVFLKETKQEYGAKALTLSHLFGQIRTQLP